MFSIGKLMCPRFAEFLTGLKCLFAVLSTDDASCDAREVLRHFFLLSSKLPMLKLITFAHIRKSYQYFCLEESDNKEKL